jgi:hypothetical protein
LDLPPLHHVECPGKDFSGTCRPLAGASVKLVLVDLVAVWWTGWAHRVLQRWAQVNDIWWKVLHSHVPSPSSPGHFWCWATPCMFNSDDSPVGQSPRPDWCTRPIPSSQADLRDTAKPVFSCLRVASCVLYRLAGLGSASHQPFRAVGFEIASTLLCGTVFRKDQRVHHRSTSTRTCFCTPPVSASEGENCDVMYHLRLCTSLLASALPSPTPHFRHPHFLDLWRFRCLGKGLGPQQRNREGILASKFLFLSFWARTFLSR